MRKGKRSREEVAKERGWLTPTQVAERYGMSLQWSYHCLELQPIKRHIGKYVYYAIEDLEVLEKTDRDKATGGKTMPLDWAKYLVEKKRKEDAEKRVKFGIL